MYTSGQWWDKGYILRIVFSVSPSSNIEIHGSNNRTEPSDFACFTESSEGVLISFFISRTFCSLKHNNLWIISRAEMKETLQCVGWPFRPPASHFSEKLTALRDSLIRFHLSSHSRRTCFTSFTREQSKKNRHGNVLKLEPYKVFLLLYVTICSILCYWSMKIIKCFSV